MKKLENHVNRLFYLPIPLVAELEEVAVGRGASLTQVVKDILNEWNRKRKAKEQKKDLA